MTEQRAAEDAVPILEAALALHQAHMDGTEPTSPESQGQLMGLIEAALLVVESQPNEPMDQTTPDSE